jgi:hypothetical protein
MTAAQCNLQHTPAGHSPLLVFPAVEVSNKHEDNTCLLHAHSPPRCCASHQHHRDAYSKPKHYNDSRLQPTAWKPAEHITSTASTPQWRTANASHHASALASILASAFCTKAALPRPAHSRTYAAAAAAAAMSSATRNSTGMTNHPVHVAYDAHTCTCRRTHGVCLGRHHWHGIT